MATYPLGNFHTWLFPQHLSILGTITDKRERGGEREQERWGRRGWEERRPECSYSFQRAKSVCPQALDMLSECFSDLTHAGPCELSDSTKLCLPATPLLETLLPLYLPLYFTSQVPQVSLSMQGLLPVPCIILHLHFGAFKLLVTICDMCFCVCSPPDCKLSITWALPPCSCLICSTHWCWTH